MTLLAHQQKKSKNKVVNLDNISKKNGIPKKIYDEQEFLKKLFTYMEMNCLNLKIMGPKNLFKIKKIAQSSTKLENMILGNKRMPINQCLCISSRKMLEFVCT